MSSNDDLYGELDVEEEDQTIGGPSLNSLSGGEVVEDSNKISQIVNNGAESRLSSENWELSSNDRCFIVKPDSYAEIESSFRDGELQPPQWVRDRLLSACKNGGVFLVFSVNNSRAFQGYAEVDPKTAQMTDTEGHKIKLAWKKLCSLPHSTTLSILNKYNGNQPVKTSRDGQELEKTAATNLIRQIQLEEEQTLETIKGILKEVENAPDFNAHGPYSSNCDVDGQNQKRSRHEEPVASFKPGEHPALFNLDIKNMTYEEYLEQYGLRMALARDKFHAQLAAAAATSGGPHMGMMIHPGAMGMPHGLPGGGFYPPGGPGPMIGPPGHFGMHGGPGMYQPPHMQGVGYFGASRGRFGGGGRGRGGGRGYY